MITNISMKNFRSAETADIPLAPITVVYGPTSSGKSSLLYAPLVLRNFVLNPNRQADAYLHLGFMDLGGFDACVFNHDTGRNIDITITHHDNGKTASYGLDFSKTAGTLYLKTETLDMKANVPIPYALNQSFTHSYLERSDPPLGEADGEEYSINWNGIACTAAPKKPSPATQQRAQELAASLNAPGEALKAVDIAPHRRGFFKSNYTPVGTSPTPTTEDEVASLIINDPHMAGRISVYTEEIFGRDFRLHVPPGTSTVFFQTTDKKARVPVLLVNEGFGVNQVIYMLAKVHRVDTRTLLIEEPEVHLHPTVLRNFARALCNVMREDHKQIILTTHSELFLSSLLTVVEEGLIKADEIKCYLVTKDRRNTIFKQQKVRESGQIEGGLTPFIEAEYEDLKKFLGVK